MTCSKKYLFYPFLLVLAFQYCFAENPVKFGFPANSGNPLFLAVSETYKEAFLPLGREVEVVPCAPSYCALLSLRGDIEGEALRHKAYSSLYPSFKRVDFLLLNLRVVLVTRKGVTDISSLEGVKRKRFKVAYQMGYRGKGGALSRIGILFQYLVAIVGN